MDAILADAVCPLSEEDLQTEIARMSIADPAFVGALMDERRISPIWLRVRGIDVYIGGSIHAAAAAGDVSATEEMLDNLYPVDETDNNGFTALHYGCANGKVGVVQLLLDKGAACAAPRKCMTATPLNLALAHGHTSVVLMLLAAAMIDRS
jgi:ankyrin repeat protein